MKALRPCPGTPNCVSSVTDSVSQRIDPIVYSGSSANAQRRLEDILRAMPRTTITRSEAGYVTAEFRSLIFRFVDEAEFSFDDEHKCIHFRSGARSGYSDFGVNRGRILKIAAAFAAGN